MRRILTCSLLAVALIGCGNVLEVDDLESLIGEWAAEFALGTVSVDCGDETVPAEVGYEFDCQLSDDTGTFTVRVTVLTEDGEVEWELLG
ncbi:MAG: DUF4333 domain-containing protein [Ilumatobacteraceae bacterium]